MAVCPYKIGTECGKLRSSDYSHKLKGDYDLVYWSILWIWRLVDLYVLNIPDQPGIMGWVLPPGLILATPDSTFANQRQKMMYLRNEYYDMVESWSDTIIFIYLIYSLIIASVIFCIEDRYGSLPNGDPARWYHYITLVLFEISFSFSIVMSIYRLWLIGIPNWNLWTVNLYLINCETELNTIVCLGILNITWFQWSLWDWNWYSIDCQSDFFTLSSQFLMDWCLYWQTIFLIWSNVDLKQLIWQ